jgi:hypothetical protein
MKEEFDQFDIGSLPEAATLSKQMPLVEDQQTTLPQDQLQGDEATIDDGGEAATPFFGHGETASATYNPKKEQPHHRAICILLAQGFVPKEVAEMTGFTTVTINYVRAQPWALRLIAELMQKAGRKAVMSELQGAAVEAAKTLINTMRNNEEGEAMGAKASDRAKAANDILNRLYGTAPQVVAHGNVNVAELTDDILATIASGTNK